MKQKNWWFYLAVIPAAVLVSGLVFAAGALLDGAFAGHGNGSGHPVPVFSLLAIVLAPLLLILGLIYAVAGLIRLLLQKKRDPEAVMTKGTSMSAGRNPMVLLPIPVSIVISLILLTISGTVEINAFYNDPTHIGFAVPIVTFLLAILCFFICLVILIVCLVLYFRRPKQQSSASVICPRCGCSNPVSAAFCTNCGMRLH